MSDLLIITGKPSPTEQETGVPLSGSSGLLLNRTLSRADIHLSSLDKAFLNEDTAAVLQLRQPKVIVTLGQEALEFLTGTTQDILTMRGYPIWDQMRNCWIMPTVHPDFMREGNSEYGRVLVHDFERAIGLEGKVYKRQTYPNYTLDPDPTEAYLWGSAYRLDLQNNPTIKLAFDIETPWKGVDEEVSASDLKDEQRKITRISFCYRAGYSMSIPWKPEYFSAIQHILSTTGPKIVWNEHFDCPVIRGNQVIINGIIHDGMNLWHVLYPELRKKLSFAATFLCPEQERWKHLSHVNPALYNAIDSDVELQCVLECERRLQARGTYTVYRDQILYVNLPLTAMSKAGMPVDEDTRWDSAEKLDDLITLNFNAVQVATEGIARKKEYKKFKQLPEGAVVVKESVLKIVKVCSKCNQVYTSKTAHYKGGKKNPCYGAETLKEPRATQVDVTIMPFNPGSWQQILQYGKEKGHRKISYKGKSTTDDKALKKLCAYYPDDKLYPLILESRKLDKLAGTYIGRIEHV